MKTELTPQINQIENGFRTSNHRFLNQLSNGIIKSVREMAPGLELRLTDKAIEQDKIIATLVGTVTFESEEKRSRALDRIRQYMNDMKNESKLISEVKE